MGQVICGTDQFTSDNVGDREQIVIPSTFAPCHKILIQEPLATTAYRLYKSPTGGSFIRRIAGQELVIQLSDRQLPFEPGDVVGYMATEDASATFNILGTEEKA